jgi:hypothetical protein
MRTVRIPDSCPCKGILEHRDLYEGFTHLSFLEQFILSGTHGKPPCLSTALKTKNAFGR